MKLSIVIPVFNEEKTVKEVIDNLIEIKIPDLQKEIIVVNDGSTDGTSETLQKLKNRKVQYLKIINHKVNQGKGAAVRTGIENATGDYILIQDADLEYHPKDIIKLFGPVKKGHAVVVYGTRLRRLPDFSRDEKRLRFFIHYLGNKFLSFLTSALYGSWITDMETGYKFFPRNSLEGIKLYARSFDFEPEITAKLLKKGYKIFEVPISTNPRGYEEGKKLNTVRDGGIALWTLVKYRFVD